jgi:hypothetical protein
MSNEGATIKTRNLALLVFDISCLIIKSNRAPNTNYTPVGLPALPFEPISGGIAEPSAR